jgi:ABC-2 type transport system ATP-binding protein
MYGVDAPAAITARYEHPLLAVRAEGRYRLIQALRALPHARAVHAFGDSVHYTDARAGADAGAVAGELVAALRERGFADAEARPVEATIEDSFMALMGEPEAV